MPDRAALGRFSGVFFRARAPRRMSDHLVSRAIPLRPTERSQDRGLANRPRPGPRARARQIDLVNPTTRRRPCRRRLPQTVDGVPPLAVRRVHLHVAVAAAEPSLAPRSASASASSSVQLRSSRPAAITITSHQRLVSQSHRPRQSLTLLSSRTSSSRVEDGGRRRAAGGCPGRRSSSRRRVDSGRSVGHTTGSVAP